MITVRQDIAHEIATQKKTLEASRTKVSEMMIAGQQLDSYTLRRLTNQEMMFQLWTNVETVLSRVDAANPEAALTLVEVLEGVAVKIRGLLLNWTPRQSTDGFDVWVDVQRHAARQEFLSDIENMIRDAVREAEAK